MTILKLKVNYFFFTIQNEYQEIRNESEEKEIKSEETISEKPKLNEADETSVIIN